MAAPKAKDPRGTLRRLWTYIGRTPGALVLALILVIVTTLLQAVWPFVMARAIDDYIIPGDMAGLRRLILMLVGIFLLSSLLTWLQARIIVGIAQRAIRDLRNDLFAKVHVLPLRFFDQRPHGDTMSRLTNDVQSLSQLLTEGTSQIISSVLTAVTVAIVMLSLNWRLGLISLASLAIATVVMNRGIGPRTRSGFREQQKNLGTLNGIIEETITGQRVVKAYHQEALKLEQFTEANESLKTASTRAQTLSGSVGPLMNFIGNIVLAVVAASGGWFAVTGRATIGIATAFLSYTRQMTQPVNQLSMMYTQLQSALAGAERFFEILDEEPEVDAETRAEPVITNGDVVFTDVDFSYDGSTPVLKHVSLHAHPGDIVALVGPTGAGKTTIINLLTRFYEIDAGEIRIDGTDLRDINKGELRQRLGLVLQDSFLFVGTVRENIRYGRLNATDAEVTAAAEAAQADHFIRHLPHGYDTELTERGGNVSHGQRQLIAIARALIADPAILILDEATSNVDTRTEKLIQSGMKTLMQGRTSFVIAHRLSTIREADQILVINRGEIVERGRHAELLDADGFYARLNTSQFRGDDELAREEEAAQIREQELQAASS